LALAIGTDYNTEEDLEDQFVIIAHDKDLDHYTHVMMEDEEDSAHRLFGLLSESLLIGPVRTEKHSDGLSVSDLSRSVSMFQLKRNLAHKTL
jgi:hypothetical protein